MTKFQRHAARAVLGVVFGVCIASAAWAQSAPIDSSLAGSPEYQSANAAAPTTTMQDSASCNQPGISCTVDVNGMTRYNLVDPAEKLMVSIPGAQTMWKQCYDDCRQHQECNPGICSSHCVGEVMAIVKSTQGISDMMKYNTMAAAGAMCIGKMVDYVKKIQQAITSISSGDPLEIMANALIDAIADQIMTQILNSLTNEICAITNEILNFTDSVIKNAICLPVGSVGNPFDFNLNLKDMQCNGLSVDLLTGQTNGSLINGISTPNVNVYSTGSTSTPVTNTTVAVPTLDPVVVPTVTETLTTVPNVDPTTLTTTPSTSTGGTQ